MNALNRAKIAHTLEDAASKILTILKYDEENNDNTILCPLITLKALFEINVELVAQFPPIHKSPYYEDVEYRSKKFLEWINQWPETLTLATIREDPEFASMTKKYVKMIYDAHLLLKRYEPPPSAVWGIEYQTNHFMTTHGINRGQRQQAEDLVANMACNQFCKMQEIQKRMAKVMDQKYSPLYSAGPGGLDVPYVYTESKHTVKVFTEKTEWKKDQIEALEKFKIIADGKKPIISPIIIRIKQEEDLDEDEPPTKIARHTDTDMMF